LRAPRCCVRTSTSSDKPGSGVAGVWGYLRERKRFWVPIVVMTVILGGAILVSAGLGLVPFTYTRL